MTAPLVARRRFWPRSLAGKAAAVVAAAAALVAVLWVVADVTTERRVREAAAFSDRFGLPRTFEALVGPPIPPERNAAVALQEATEIATEELAKSPDFRAGSYSISSSELAEPARLYGNERYEALIKTADERPEYRSLAVGEDDAPTFGAYWRLMERCRFVSAELAIARWLGLQGKRKEAIGRLLRLLRISRKWDEREPTYWAAIIRQNIEHSACYLLALNLRGGVFQSYVHEAIEVELAQSIDYTQSALRGMQAEKLQMLRFCDLYWGTAGSLVFRPLRNLDKLYALDFVNRSMENMTLPLAEVRPAQLRREETDKNMRANYLHQWAHPVSAKYLPSFQNLVEEWRYPMVMARCTRILNAMEQQGKLRSDLDSLGLPPECLIDPFDGKRLRVKYSDKGPSIYSVGPNLKDDGGDYKEGRDIGLWPPEETAKK